MSKVTFDGTDKIISVDDGITSLDVKVDLYSEWKIWVQESDNSKYAPAFRTVGGDEISPGLSITGTYFLLNGWRIRPAEENHTLKIIGNLYVDGEDVTPIISTLGDFNISVQMQTSNIVSTVAVGSGVTNQDKTDIIDGVKTALDPDIKTMLGLMHRNFKFVNQVYDADGNLTSGTIRIFNSAAEAQANASPYKTFTIAASYTDKKLTSYQMVEV